MSLRRPRNVQIERKILRPCVYEGVRVMAIFGGVVDGQRAILIGAGHSLWVPEDEVRFLDK